MVKVVVCGYKSFCVYVFNYEAEVSFSHCQISGVGDISQLVGDVCPDDTRFGR